jgi:hypothetical protein
MLNIYYNGVRHNQININSLQHENNTQLPSQITVAGSGTLVPAFGQISPDVVDRNSSSNLTVTRLYMLDKSGLYSPEILRVFNEPHFSVVHNKFRVDWREFYQTGSNTSALVAPSSEPDLGTLQ